MSVNLEALHPSLINLPATEKVQDAGGGDFGHAFTHALTQARELEGQAQTASDQFANGDPQMGIHEVMIATEKASLALRYATTLKNKALEAYKELMNTQV